MTPLDANWIDGTWQRTASTRALPVVDPTTEETFAELSCATQTEVDAAVRSARTALSSWRASSLAARAALLRRLAELLGARTETFAGLLAREIGCPLWFSRDLQVPMPVRNLAAMAAALDAMALEEQAGTSVIWREPIGVVAAITPWNAPLHQIVAKVGAAIAAGCTIVVKPSELAPGTVRELVEVMREAGVPAGVVNVVFGDGETGRGLVEHPDIDMVSFTGSVAAGRKVGAAAGHGIKKAALELGGKSAAIVLRDAALDQAVAGVLRTCFGNSGQVCVAQTRLLVAVEDQPAVEDLCATLGAGWVVGPPLDPATRVGPVASRAARDRVDGFVSGGLAEGARAVLGGAGAPDRMARGFFVRPTILADVTPGMEVSREEVFGPVLVVQGYRDVDEAVELANATRYGLSGAVWSGDRARGLEIARRMRTGQVSLNGAPQNYATPFGGCGWSGIGRENGRFGIEEFLQFKAVHGALAA